MCRSGSGRRAANQGAPSELFAGLPVSYAVDDGTAFPGWAPPPLTADEARASHELGERYAVLGGEPASPAAALSLDGRNGRIAVTAPGDWSAVYLRPVVSGRAAKAEDAPPADLVLTEARQVAPDGARLVVSRGAGPLLRVRRQPAGAPLPLVEQLAVRAVTDAETFAWPSFGDVTLPSGDPRGDLRTAAGVDALILVDADAWLLDVLVEAEVATRWRELSRTYEAPRAVGLKPDGQEKIAVARGFRKATGGWRLEDDRDGATVVTSVGVSASAGGMATAGVAVSRGPVDVAVGLPAATTRLEVVEHGSVRGPAFPRPSAGSQVAVAAVFDLAALLHERVLARVDAGGIPAGWADLVD